MSETITILVATMSGTAELVADTMADSINDAGYRAKVTRMEKANIATLSAGGLWIICSSTYGTGEVPDNGKAFFEALETQRPDLSAVRYGVVSLGDSIYPATYCFGGKKFDELFASLKAQRIGERMQHDRRSAVYPEDAASEWVAGWLEQLVHA